MLSDVMTEVDRATQQTDQLQVGDRDSVTSSESI